MQTTIATLPLVATSELPKPLRRAAYTFFCGHMTCELAHLFQEMQLLPPGTAVPDGFTVVRGIMMTSERKKPGATLCVQLTAELRQAWADFAGGLYGTQFTTETAPDIIGVQLTRCVDDTWTVKVLQNPAQCDISSDWVVGTLTGDVLSGAMAFLQVPIDPAQRKAQFPALCRPCAA